MCLYIYVYICTDVMLDWYIYMHAACFVCAACCALCAYLLPDAPITVLYSLYWPMSSEQCDTQCQGGPGRGGQAAVSDNTTLGSAQFCQSRQHNRGRERERLCLRSSVVSDLKQRKGISSVKNVQKVKRIVFFRDFVRSAVSNIWIIQRK